MPRATPDERLMQFCKGCRNANPETCKCDIFIEPKYQWRKGKCWGARGPEIVYLGGSIDGHKSLDEANEWRLRAADTLEKAGFIILNPLQREDRTEGMRAIVEQDLKDIRRSDILLVEMSFESIQHIGTAMEIRYAWERGKKIIIWGSACQESFFLRYHITKRYGTLTEALYNLTAERQNKKGVL